MTAAGYIQAIADCIVRDFNPVQLVLDTDAILQAMARLFMGVPHPPV